MHAKQLVELASLVTTESPVLVRGTRQLPSTALEEYWVASKCRMQQWTTAIATFRDETKWASKECQSLKWLANRHIFEEIIVSEVLTRVWGSTLVAIDDTLRTQDYAPIARSVFVSHLEARNRVLRLLTSESLIDRFHSKKIDRLRQQAERWTDLLLSYQAHDCDVSEFAFDILRVEDFSSDHRCRRLELPWQTDLQPLVTLAVRRWLDGIQTDAYQSRLNAQIGQSVLGCIDPRLFLETGKLSSIWQLRLSKAGSDAAMMIDQLLQPEQEVSADPQWLRRG